MEQALGLMFMIAGLYLLVGLVFAILFLIYGVEKVDAAAKGTPWGFRLLILPGVMALWPLLLIKWIKA